MVDSEGIRLASELASELGPGYMIEEVRLGMDLGSWDLNGDMGPFGIVW